MKASLVKILVVVVVAIIELVVLRQFGLVKEGMANINADSSANVTNAVRQDGLDATAGPGTTQTSNMSQMNNPELVGNGTQSVYSANADPGVQALRGQNCFPKEQLTPAELLPQDNSSAWAQVNPTGSGTLKDRNFLQSGHHIGINTVGQTKRNPNLQLRSEPPNPQVKASPWLQSTIDPDTNRKPFELGGCA